MKRGVSRSRRAFAAVLALVCLATMLGVVAGGPKFAAGADLCIDSCTEDFSPDTRLLGHRTTAVILNDLDGDGDLDLLAGYINHPSRVYWNDGNGTFIDSKQVLGTKLSHGSFAVGDLDGDGDPDLLTGEERGPDRIYRNDGTGIFTAIGHMPESVFSALGDVDGDGDLDLLAGYSGKASQVFLNDGKGTFTRSVQLPGSDNTRSIVLGDVDGDGDLDLVTIIYDAPDRVCRNDGNGHFTDTGQALESDYVWSASLGDIDGDGDLDMVEGHYDAPNRVYLNDGTGTFIDSAQKLEVFNTRSVALGDIDGDGDLDMMEGNDAFGPNHVYLNDGTGTFASPPPKPDWGSPYHAGTFVPSFVESASGPSELNIKGWEGQTGPRGGDPTIDDRALDNNKNITAITHQELGDSDTRSIALGDVDGDGDLDMVAGNEGQPDRVYRNNGKGIFTDTGQLLGRSLDILSVALGDVDGDGDPDLVAGDSTGRGQPNVVYQNDGTGVFTDTVQLLGRSATASVALGDVDGDGDLDLVTGNNDTGGDAQPNRVYLNNGKGTFSDSRQALGNDYTSSIALGDVDGDGDLDMVAGNARHKPNRVYRNNGNGIFTDSGSALGTTDTHSISLGDIDGDGDLDLIEVGSDGRTHVYRNTGRGAFSSFGLMRIRGQGTIRILAMGDVDGDGDLDVVSNGKGDTRMYLNDGTGVFIDSGQVLEGAAGFDSSVALGDVDGDGDLDLVIRGFNRSKLIQVYANNGKGTFTATSQVRGNYLFRSLALSDVDGDGDLDLVTWNRDEIGLVYRNDGKGIFLAAYPMERDPRVTKKATDTNTRFVVLGDVDGDGDLDLVEGNEGQPNRMFLNDGEGSFSPTGQPLGSSDSFCVVLGDVDGDGDLDLVEGNHGANQVHLNDGNGAFSDSGQKLGRFQTDSIALGDLDGDGDVDMVERIMHGLTRIYRNDGTGGFTALDMKDREWRLFYEPRSHFVDLGDVDGDGDTDLVMQNLKWGQFRVLRNDGAIAFTGTNQESDFYFSSRVSFGTLGDVDGDGDLDLIAMARKPGPIRGPGMGNKVYLNDGTGAFTGTDQDLEIYTAESIALGDVDGDGDLDLVVGTDGVNRVYLNDGRGTFTETGRVLLGKSVTRSITQDGRALVARSR